jgi:hypothetical protein
MSDPLLLSKRYFRNGIFDRIWESIINPLTHFPAISKGVCVFFCVMLHAMSDRRSIDASTATTANIVQNLNFIGNPQSDQLLYCFHKLFKNFEALASQSRYPLMKSSCVLADLSISAVCKRANNERYAYSCCTGQAVRERTCLIYKHKHFENFSNAQQKSI